MLTFTVNQANTADQYAAELWSVIADNSGYFKKFNGEHFKEAMTRTYLWALENRNVKYDNLLPYVKKLARVIMRTNSRTPLPCDFYTEDGEISNVFRTLTDSINEQVVFADEREIRNTFKELYLLDADSFLKLKNLFLYDSAVQLKKVVRITNKQFSREFNRMLERYGSEFTYSALFKFLSELPELCAERKTSGTLDVTLKEGNYALLKNISKEGLIRDVKGKQYGIDTNTLLMERNPDFFKWESVGGSASDVLRLDFGDFVNYMYEQVCVDPGVRTRHIEWCDDRYRLLSPAGTPYLGMEQERFLELVRIELLLNLMNANIGTIVAVSPDNVYFKPSRSFTYNKLRIKFSTGKVMDLPVTTHARKRKVTA